MEKEEEKKCDQPIFKCETEEKVSLTDSQHVCTIKYKNTTTLCQRCQFNDIFGNFLKDPFNDFPPPKKKQQIW